MAKYNLLLDDERTIKMVLELTGNKMYVDLDWVIVRTFDQFCDAINKLGIPRNC